MRRIEQLTALKYSEQNASIKGAFNVLADHIRASCFLIADGVNPSNEGRGYVLRKVIRRAALFAQKLSEKSIFPELAPAVIQDMGGIYPELQEHEKTIIRILNAEVEKFATNLVQGQHIFDRYCKESTDGIIKGEQIFKLYDTYGFPLEITRIIAQERGLAVDIDGFEQYMEEQRQRSGKKDTTQEISLSESLKTEFTGYDHLMTEAVITGLLHNDHEVREVPAGVSCWVITNKSPFYVEKGGQVSDQGWLLINKEKIPVQELKRIDGTIAARITTHSAINIGQPIGTIVDRESRLSIMKNHTATHLLQSALIALLGKQVRQAGSLVAPDYLRFDFTYHEHLTPEQIKQVECIVNEKIWENIPVSIFTTTYKKAIEKGVMAIFGEKYNPEDVRVIDIPGFSAELCGGTHVRATGDIGCFKITEVAALSAGQRRIVAVTGPKALVLFQDNFTVIKQLSQDFRVPHQEVLQAVHKQSEQLKIVHDDLKRLHKKLMALHIPQWLDAARQINGMPFGFVQLEDASSDQMREIAQDLIAKKPGFYVIFTTHEQQSLCVALVSPLYQDRVNLKEFATWIKQTFNLHGGGKPTMFQGGGALINADQCKKAIEEWLMAH